MSTTRAMISVVNEYFTLVPGYNGESYILKAFSEDGSEYYMYIEEWMLDDLADLGVALKGAMEDT